MKHFSRTFKVWPLSHNEKLNITEIVTKGTDLDDFLCNAEIYVEDWHGNDIPDVQLSDLSLKDQVEIQMMFNEYLLGI